ncbi:MAG TPA: hypothetical protein VES20_24590 [Bryobacteraceae bacterium]|nr:hypothetical protein [Bryobacteraceae bacterium]
MRRVTPVVLLTALAAPALAGDLQVRLEAGTLRLSASRLQFLTGKPLERLRNGASVAFDIQVSVLADSRQSILRRSFERFVVSYDVWEERFSVTRMRSSRSSASHLTAAAAQAWCLERFSMEAGGLPDNRPLWFRLDVRAAEARDPNNDESLSLAALIELFSRPVKLSSGGQWRAESDAVVIAELRGKAATP